MQLWIGGLHFTQFGLRILEDAQEPLTQACMQDTQPVSFSKYFFHLFHCQANGH